MGIDDRAADRQPQAETAVLGRVKRIEDAFRIGMRQSRARIADCDQVTVRSAIHVPHQ